MQKQIENSFAASRSKVVYNLNQLALNIEILIWVNSIGFIPCLVSQMA